jgi:hypothetical protein
MVSCSPGTAQWVFDKYALAQTHQDGLQPSELALNRPDFSA